MFGQSVSDAAQFGPLLDHPRYRVYYSYGQGIPDDLEPGFLFWGAGRYACSMLAARDDFTPSSAGAQWMSGLPTEFTGRVVHNCTLAELINSRAVWDRGSVWLKPAELKHPALPPSQWTRDRIAGVVVTNPELGGVSVQWTNTIMDFAAEFRFFVVDGDAVTGSPYLVDGVADHSAGRSWSRYADAHAVARDFAVALAGSSPRALVLDIGWDRTRRGWFIVEANRPWSSGLYGCDPDEVAAVIEVSMRDDSRWEWKPDPVVWSYAETLRPVSGTRLSSGLWLV